MSLDETKSKWRKQNEELGKAIEVPFQDLVDRTAKLESRIWRGDVCQAVSATIVVTFFAIFLAKVPCPIGVQIGVGMIMLGVVVALGVTYWTRHRDAPPHPDSSLLEFSKAERRRVERRIHLLRNVNWWFIAPIMLGVGVFFTGMFVAVPELPTHIVLIFLPAFYLCVLAAAYIIYRINMDEAQKALVPFRDELSEMIESLDENTEDAGPSNSTE